MIYNNKATIANNATITTTTGPLVWDTTNNTLGNINTNVPLTGSTTSAWSSVYNSISDILITSNIPSIFTISKITKKSSKSLLIQYVPVSDKICPLASEGNIYISGAKVFGVYTSKDNYYWNYKLIVEFESEKDTSKVKEGDTFTNATQWEKKLSVQEIIDMLENKDIYYKYVHSQIEEVIKEDTLSSKIDKHRSIDKLYGFEE